MIPAEKKIDLAEFPECCGILIFKNFYNYIQKTAEYYLKHNPLWTKERAQSSAVNYNTYMRHLLETEEEYRQRVKNGLLEIIHLWRGRKSYFLVTLNKEEYDIIDDILLDLGLEVLVPEMKNPTGSFIKLYVYYLCAKPGTESKQESILKKAA